MKIFHFILIITSLFLLVSIQPIHAAEQQLRACSNTADILRKACGFEVKDDYLNGLAVCINLKDKAERDACFVDTRLVRDEAREDCGAVFSARKDLCRDMGEARYDPPFGSDFADNFVNPVEIGRTVNPNPYFPLIPGSQWVYQGKVLDDAGNEETETITVSVSSKTKLIEGITCLVVNDVVTIGADDQLVEDTDDWYAQDLQGNVWYCGEIAENFEFFDGDNPEIAELVDVDGSWKSGRDGARAGIQVPAIPAVGEVFRQEISWGNAEDVIEIISASGTESSPAASCNGNCMVTRDFTPLDPGIEENKYYLPELGKIVEINLDTGTRVELIEYTRP